MDSPNYYAVIPAEIRYNSSLSDREKLLYGEITCLCNKTGECWASNEYFANLYGVSTRSIRTSITNLVDNGYINRKVFFKEGTKEIEKRVLTLGKNSSIPYGKILPYPEEKFFLDNNTSINTTSIIKENNKKKELEQDFEEWYVTYPRKINKKLALGSYLRARKKTTKEKLLEGVVHYSEFIKARKTEVNYIKHPSTWLNQELWDEEYEELTPKKKELPEYNPYRIY